MAVASSGSVFSTTTNRAAPPDVASIGLSEAATLGRLDGLGRLAGAASSATPGWAASSCCSRARAAVCRATPGPMTRISVGDKMPGAKPSAAAVPARAAGDDAGSSLISGDPRWMVWAPQAAASRPAVPAAAISSATGRAAANRAARVSGSSASAAWRPRARRPPAC